MGSLAGAAHLNHKLCRDLRSLFKDSVSTTAIGLLERVGTGIVGTIGYVVLPTGVSTDVSRDVV